MAKNLKFEILFKAVDQGAMRAIAAVQKQVEKVNDAARKTQGLREGAMRLAAFGAVAVGAGGAIAYGLKKTVDSFAELQDEQDRLLTALPKGAEGMRDVAAATQLANKASVQFGVSQESVLENIFLGVSAGLTLQQAFDNATASLETAIGTRGDIAETGRVMAQVVKLFGDASLTGKAAAQQIQHFNDVTAYVVRNKAFANIGELNEALKESIGAAKAAGMSYDDLLASLAGFQQAGLTGTEAGEALEEALQALGRGGFQKAGVAVATFKNGALDVIGSLVNLKRAYEGGSISLAQFMRLSKAMGVRGTRALALNPEDLLKAQSELHGVAVAGAALGGAQIMMRGVNEQWKRVQQSIIQVSEAFGAALAPAVTSVAKVLTPMLAGFARFAQYHSTLTRYVAEFAAISAGLLIFTGALSLAGAAFLYVASFVPTVFAIANAIQIVTIATKAWSVAMAALDAVMALNPIALAIIGAVALAAIAYEVIKHWTAVKGFFLSLGHEIYSALLWPFEALPKAIMEKIDAIKGAASHVAHAIGRFFVGHSPIPEGPLHNLDLSREIGRSMRPTRVMNAARAAAAAAMIGFAAVPSPANAATVHYAPVVNVTVNGTGDPATIRNAVLEALREHSAEVHAAVKKAQRVERRRSFGNDEEKD